MGILDGTRAEASVDTQASHFSHSCAEKAHRDACAHLALGRHWPQSGLGRSPGVSPAPALTVHLLAFHQRQPVTPEPQEEPQQPAEPEFPDMSGLCTPHQRKANSKTQYLWFPGQWTATWSQLAHSWSRQLPPPPLLSSVLWTKGTGMSRLVAKATFPRLFYCRPCI